MPICGTNEQQDQPTQQKYMWLWKSIVNIQTYKCQFTDDDSNKNGDKCDDVCVVQILDLWTSQKDRFNWSVVDYWQSILD